MMRYMHRARSAKLISFALLFTVICISGIAAMPATLPAPNAPTAAATTNAGEIQVRWQTVAGARFYTVGWINRNDYQRIGPSGDWLSAFHYATVPASRTSYTVSGLKAGEEYWTIIGGRRQRDGGEATSWSASWSGLVMTSGQHGGGFCPITGLPLPPGGYLSVGDTISVGRDLLTFKLDSATTPTSVPTDAGEDYTAPAGRKLLRLCGTRTNNIGADWYFRTGTHNNLSTDRGIGFARVRGWENPLPDGSRDSGCDTWTIPEVATTAVYAINLPEESTLYRINLP